MPEFCPKCGKYGFAEYIDRRGEIRCLHCGYREKKIYTSDKERIKRLIRLHINDLEAMEAEERKMPKEDPPYYERRTKLAQICHMKDCNEPATVRNRHKMSGDIFDSCERHQANGVAWEQNQI